MDLLSIFRKVKQELRLFLVLSFSDVRFLEEFHQVISQVLVDFAAAIDVERLDQAVPLGRLHFENLALVVVKN